ncbi:MAG: hypothetical protein ACRCZ9_02455 [Fusobacteriaceae bacterium]
MTLDQEIEFLTNRISDLKNQQKKETKILIENEKVSLGNKYEKDINDIISIVNARDSAMKRVTEIKNENIGKHAGCHTCLNSDEDDWLKILNRTCPLAVFCSIATGDCTLEYDWSDLKESDFCTWEGNTK